VIDDHSRVAYAEIHGDEKAETAVGVLKRAVSWFEARGVTVERVLSDNGSAYRSHAWRDTCAELGIKVKKTRPYRPQTNGKIERFHRTLADGWAFSRHYNSESACRAALLAWLHEYNHHRHHTAIGGKPPITRLTNHLVGVSQWHVKAGASGTSRLRCGNGAHVYSDPVTGQALMLTTSTGVNGIYVWDGIGNPVGLLVDFSSNVFSYEYDPYGAQVLRAGGTGNGAAQNPTPSRPASTTVPQVS
jgi:hypothetical protein